MTDIPDRIRELCTTRDANMGGGCYHCDRRTPQGQRNLHHRIPGGPSVASNLITLWPGCHIHSVHDRPADGYAGRWLVSKYDRRPTFRIPVWVQGLGWVLLDDSGGWTPVIGAGGRVAPPPRCVEMPRSLFGGPLQPRAWAGAPSQTSR
jgi:hypothetical protein